MLRVKYESIKKRFQVERSLSPPTRMRNQAEKDEGEGEGGREEGRIREGGWMEEEERRKGGRREEERRKEREEERRRVGGKREEERRKEREEERRRVGGEREEERREGGGKRKDEKIEEEREEKKERKKEGGEREREESRRREGRGKEEPKEEESRRDIMIDMEKKLFDLREENGRLLCMNEKLMEDVEKLKLISQSESKSKQKELFSQRNVAHNYNSNTLHIPSNVRQNNTLNTSLIFQLLDKSIQNSIQKTTNTFLEKIQKTEIQFESLKRMIVYVKLRMDESKNQYGVLLRELERKNEKLKEIRKDMVNIHL